MSRLAASEGDRAEFAVAEPQETGSPLRARVIGSGKREALALHCGLSSGRSWRGLSGALEEIGAGCRILAPDSLGHGESPDWDDADYDAGSGAGVGGKGGNGGEGPDGGGDYLRDMLAAVEPLLDKPMDLVGHSFGAVLALALAIARPDRVRSLALFEPVLFAVAAEDAPEALAALAAASGDLDAAFASEDWSTAARLFNKAWSGSGPRWDELPQERRVAMTRGIRVVPGSNPGLFEDSLGLVGLSRQIRAPTLLARGSESPPIMEVVSKGLARRIPGAVERVVVGAGHMLPISHPAYAARCIAEFWSGTPGLRDA